jgi:Bax protein
MYKIVIPLFFITVITYVAIIQPKTGVTANNLNMTGITDIENKKKRFFNFMRPIIEEENASILKLRNKLLTAKKQSNNKKFVTRIAQSYSTDWNPDNENWDKLLERVDMIAPELALAQSANETAWGQSRFAQQGNNFFGQWCYKKGCGLIPANRNRGATHEVAQFNNVNESVRSYIKNINTGRAYASLRKIREKNRTTGKMPDAIAQAGGLVNYSERGKKYVSEIRSLIRANKKLMSGNN